MALFFNNKRKAMKYVRAKDQKDIKVGSMVRLLPTMGWGQDPSNPIGGIGVVTKVRIGGLWNIC